MKTVILCGGLGTRLAEETQHLPKPMVTIGGYPILWHIMKIYSQYGFNDFVLPLGYKGECIKRYFLDYHCSQNDCTIDLSTGQLKTQQHTQESWRIQMKDTGQNTMTGGRLLRLKNELSKGGTFMLTYGDGVANVRIDEILAFHQRHGKLATITAVRPPARFGHLCITGDRVDAFDEKPQLASGWINGGFFVFEPAIFDYLGDDQTFLEKKPLERLAQEGQLMVHRHTGFWQCMDTLRDKQHLESLCKEPQQAPWLRQHEPLAVEAN